MTTVRQGRPGPAELQCEGCSLQGACLTRSLPLEELEAFDAIIDRPRPLKRGEALVRQGESFTSLFVVRSGSLKQVIDVDGRYDQVVHFYLPSETVGLDAIGEARCPATVLALERTFVCELPFAPLERLATRLPSLRGALYRCMGRELRGDQRQVCLLSGRTAEQRLAGFLLGLSERFHARGCSRYRFHLAMSRADIGSHLGLALETVSRVMGRFQRQGLVAMAGREVTLRSLEGLTAIAENGPR
ncbi:helix-turn-helix domain-containing protein [Halomonas sp. 3H]|uniref:helix-turn-helix domain-containing protein n=1 Tax=Halomonas sp. 3H TaxID=2952527 RepID=UPI0020B646E0|nr:helix-turn-helix domain-containing protein [Halomonas sp. 3H]